MNILPDALHRHMWVVLWCPEASMPEIAQMVPAHIDYLLELEGRNLVFASGPFSEAAGTMVGRGMTILNVADEERAREVAAGDPLVKAGLRSFELHRWDMVEGAVTVRLRLSDTTFNVV